MIALPPARPPVARTVADLLLFAAQAWPDAEAVVFPDERLTYSELARRAWRFALSLSQLGIGRDDNVGLLMLNSSEFVTSFFGIAMTGAVVVPINARYRSNELTFLLDNADLRALVTHDRYYDHIDFAALLHQAVPGLEEAQDPARLSLPSMPKLRTVIMHGAAAPAGLLNWRDFDALADVANPEPLAKTCASVPVRSLAAIIYTSGTTAQPRGAMLSHEALVAGWSMVARRWGLDSESRFWVPVPLFHIAALGPLIGVMSLGGCFISASHFEATRALAQIEQEKATMLYPCYPPITQAIISHPAFSSRDFSSVKTWVNVAPPDTLRSMAAALPGAIQLSTYGGTEGGPVTLHSLGDDENTRILTCGTPMPGVEVRIIDPETRELLPCGAVGEIIYRGYQTFEGYYRDKEKTASSFDNGWFLTGDLGAFDARNQLSYIGRLKDMLKVGGENVAPAEVEAFLETHPAVKLAQVVGIPDPRLIEVVAAFVELHEGASVSEKELIDFCRGQIAAFKVPRIIRIVSSWPMSATKIQRNKLRSDLLADLKG
jgi:fatty-acyl-CoA synthase